MVPNHLDRVDFLVSHNAKLRGREMSREKCEKAKNLD